MRGLVVMSLVSHEYVRRNASWGEGRGAEGREGIKRGLVVMSPVVIDTYL